VISFLFIQANHDFNISYTHRNAPFDGTSCSLEIDSSLIAAIRSQLMRENRGLRGEAPNKRICWPAKFSACCNVTLYTLPQGHLPGKR
jgi:hypothetical protein